MRRWRRPGAGDEGAAALRDAMTISSAAAPAQEAAAIFRRKQIYEALHPETRAEANASAERKTSDNLSFVSATAQTVGKDKRTVERAAARGEALGDDLAAVAGTSLDKGIELDALRISVACKFLPDRC